MLKLHALSIAIAGFLYTSAIATLATASYEGRIASTSVPMLASLRTTTFAFMLSVIDSQTDIHCIDDATRRTWPRLFVRQQCIIMHSKAEIDGVYTPSDQCRVGSYLVPGLGALYLN